VFVTALVVGKCDDIWYMSDEMNEGELIFGILLAVAFF
jgi:hypothetical protein